MTFGFILIFASRVLRCCQTPALANDRQAGEHVLQALHKGARVEVGESGLEPVAGPTDGP